MPPTRITFKAEGMRNNILIWSGLINTLTPYYNLINHAGDADKPDLQALIDDFITFYCSSKPTQVHNDTTVTSIFMMTNKFTVDGAGLKCLRIIQIELR